MKYHVMHTHLNPRKDPIFLVVDGPKEDCLECRRKAKAHHPRSRRAGTLRSRKAKRAHA
jgi:hypothetical protein